MNGTRAFLCAAFAVIAACGGARTAAAQSSDFVTQLTEDNIALFLEETKTVSLGKRDDMLPEDIESYLNHHLAPKGSFRSKTKFEIPGYPIQEAEMKLNRDEYIAKVLEGQDLIADYETAIEIKKIKIENGGRAAMVTTVSTEHGKLPWPDGQGNEKTVPVKGHSECEQKLIVSLSNYIQMADADCATVISFLPFGDKPLGE